MRKRVNPITATFLVAATLSGLSMLAYAETTPTVGGPESVQDWWRAGQEFIRESQHERDVRRRAKNIILFVGDGMGISTVTAARILEGQIKMGWAKRIISSSRPFLMLLFPRHTRGINRPRTPLLP